MVLAAALVFPVAAQAALPGGVSVRIRDVWHEIDHEDNLTHLHFRAVYHNGRAHKIRVECTFVGFNSNVPIWRTKTHNVAVDPGQTIGFHMEMTGPWDDNVGWGVHKSNCKRG